MNDGMKCLDLLSCPMGSRNVATEPQGINTIKTSYYRLTSFHTYESHFKVMGSLTAGVGTICSLGLTITLKCDSYSSLGKAIR